jgi:hypothetical protein
MKRMYRCKLSIKENKKLRFYKFSKNPAFDRV